MDEFDEIISDLENAQTPRFINYLSKKAKRAMVKFSGLGSAVKEEASRKYRDVKRAIRAKSKKIR